MDQDVHAGGHARREVHARDTLCVPSFETGLVLHRGDVGFQEEVERRFELAHNQTAERLMALKSSVRDAAPEDFWKMLMEGMADLTGAQFAFVAKRILVDDQDSAIEMPPYGEPGSCLMADAYYYNDGHGKTDFFRNYSFSAYGAPCGHMRHDKVFLIPERLNDFITANPNKLPFPADAYLAIPLFSGGKCFGHFGVMWSAEGLKRRQLSWGYLELLLHSLEGLIQQRLLVGDSFCKQSVAQVSRRERKVIPHEAILASQTLKPYARSLSHELRTPMQGVVGMLDIMYATVLESAESQTNAHVRNIFETLKENIEVVQDSSRRAVEAADNVVQACDTNMRIPDTPESKVEESVQSDEGLTSLHDEQLEVLHAGDVDSPTFGLGNKRRRSLSADGGAGPYIKYRVVERVPERSLNRRTSSTHVQVDKEGSDDETKQTHQVARLNSRSNLDRAMTPRVKRTSLKAVIRTVINESLQVGGRPESAVAVSTDRGEKIEVRFRNSRGEVKQQTIQWAVDRAVPETLLVDERDVAKLVSCVFLNALKFMEDGVIELTVSLEKEGRFVLIKVKDSGPGIPRNFLPFLFRPFSREDDSLTRRKDGLGLGLLVAKSVARRIGGDVKCTRSYTSGPRRGSEFEIHVPVSMADGVQGHHHHSGVDDWERGVDGEAVDSPVLSCAVGHGKDDRTPSTISPARLSLQKQTGMMAQGFRRYNNDRANTFDPELASRYPLTFLVAEDNQINRKLLVSMLSKLGYRNVHEAFDGEDAVRQMKVVREPAIDMVLMDLWMPGMDGFEAAKRILDMLSLSEERSDEEHHSDDGRHSNDEERSDDDDEYDYHQPSTTPRPIPNLARTRTQTKKKKRRKKREVVIIAVTADATTEALNRAAEVGMQGMMTKPYKLIDLERFIVEHCCHSPIN